MKISSSAKFAPKLSELSKILRWAHSYFLQLELGLVLTRKMELALEEVVVNIMTYAGLDEKQPIEIKIQGIRGAHVEIYVKDHGPPFNPIEFKPPNLATPLEEMKDGGLGIFLLRQIVDTLDYQRIEEKNILILKKKVPPDHKK